MSKYLIKKAILISNIVLVLTSFMIGCQPTPKNPIIINKGNSNNFSGQNSEPSSQVLPTKYETPSNYQATYNREGSKLELNINASVSIPNVNAFPVTSIKPTKFTQEQVNNMVKVLFQGKTVYNAGGPITKSELEDCLIVAKAELAKGEKDPSSGYDVEDLKKTIKGIEAEIQNAPVKVDKKIASLQLHTNEYNEIRLDVKADLGKNKDATLTLMNKESGNQNDCYARFKNTNDDGTYYCFDDWHVARNTPLNLKVSKDEAINQAKKLLNDLNITDMDIVEVLPGIVGGSEESDASEISNNPKCYMIYFMRTVGGIPYTYGNTLDMKGSFIAPGSYAPPWGPEQILVCIDDSGVAEFNWQYPAAVTDTINKSITLLPFDKIMNIFDEQIFVKSAEQGDDTLKNYTYNIDKVILGLGCIQSKDNQDEYLLIPVWNFFGSIQYNYDIDAVGKEIAAFDPSKVDEEKQYYEQLNSKPMIYDYKSFITINAIDGSLVD